MSRILVTITLWDDGDDKTMPHSQFVLSEWFFTDGISVDGLPPDVFDMIADESGEEIRQIHQRIAEQTQ